jgi:hypothetical protein
VFISCLILPQCFKAATVLPLYKGKGSRKAAKNYRPISLLNIYTKIFERFVFYRLYDRVESSLAAEQHGFRKNKSCISASSIFSQHIYSSIDKRSHKSKSKRSLLHKQCSVPTHLSTTYSHNNALTTYHAILIPMTTTPTSHCCHHHHHHPQQCNHHSNQKIFN